MDTTLMAPLAPARTAMPVGIFFLLLQGVASEQLNTVSFGEERPAEFGSDDESYALNRRVELVYQ